MIVINAPVRDNSQRRNGIPGVVILISTEELRGRKIKQAPIILEHKPSMLLITLPIAIGDMKWRIDSCCHTLDLVKSFLGLNPDYGGSIALDDPRFFPGDFGQGCSEILLVIVVDSGDDGQRGTLDDVCRIQTPPQTDFQQKVVRRLPAKCHEGRCRRDLEKRYGLACIGSFTSFQSFSQFGLGNEFARNPHALAEMHQMRRGVTMDRESCRFQHRAQIGNRRAFAIGPRHMNDGREPLVRVAKSREEPPNSVKSEIDDLWMQFEQTCEDCITHKEDMTSGLIGGCGQSAFRIHKGWELNGCGFH